MKILGILFKYSRVPFILAVLVAVVSGLAGAGILALIHRFIADPGLAGERSLITVFIALCILVPVSRFGSAYILLRMSQKAVFDLRLQLCRNILAAPLRRLEDVGPHRLLATITQDVATIAAALTDFPLLCMQGAIIFGSLVYLGILSWQVLLMVVGFMVVGVLSYRLPVIWGSARQEAAREQGDALFKHYEAVTEGTKELKMHQNRRRSFFGQLEVTAGTFQRLNVAAQSIFAAAASWGQMLFFVVVGLVILVVPTVLVGVSHEVVTGFAFVLLYIMNPMQHVLDTLPMLSQAGVALAKVEKLGLSLLDEVSDLTEIAVPKLESDFREIRFEGITHAYYQDTQDDRNFNLGPIDFEMRSGELVFVIGGNGSGKTTFTKLVAGLYRPKEGRVLLDGQEVGDHNREWYRQHFSAIFSDFFLFSDLLGLDHPELDAQASGFLEQLQLSHKVSVEDGRLSTTELSQGQRKRLALLTVYLENRSIFIFDEWAADQDPLYKDVFYRQILPGLKRRGKTVLVVCHDDRYFDVADRIVKLESGKVVVDKVLAPHEIPSFELELATPEPVSGRA